MVLGAEIHCPADGSRSRRHASVNRAGVGSHTGTVQSIEEVTRAVEDLRRPLPARVLHVWLGLPAGAPGLLERVYPYPYPVPVPLPCTPTPIKIYSLTELRKR